MSASDWAAWVGAIGTIAAAWIAVWLYSRSRKDAQADAATKRRVLLAMLKEHVTLAVVDIGEAVAKLTYFSNNPLQPSTLSDLAAVLQVHSRQRMFELQAQLLDSAQVRDIALAKFIEACRAYEVHRSTMSSVAPSLAGPGFLVAGMEKHLISVTLAAAKEAQSLADNALSSLE